MRHGGLTVFPPFRKLNLLTKGFEVRTNLEVRPVSNRFRRPAIAGAEASYSPFWRENALEIQMARMIQSQQSSLLFTCPITHRRVFPATLGDFRRRLDNLAVTNAWCDSTFLSDPVWRANRRAIRLSMEEPPEMGGRGKGGSLMHQVGGAALSTPGNDYYLKADTDPSLVKAMVDWGYLYQPRYFRDAEDLLQQVKQSGRKLLGTDDYPPMFREVLVNQPEWFVTCGDKAGLAELVDSHFLPTEVVIELGETNWDQALDEVSESGRHTVYFKDVDGQHGGTGVEPIFNDHGFDSMSQRLHTMMVERRKSVERVNLAVEEALAVNPENPLGLRKLSTRFVLQRGFGSGHNMSFQIFLDPKTPNEIPVLSIAEQRTAENGRNLGNRFLPVNAETVTHAVASAMASTVDKIWSRFPQATGCLMWDYFVKPGGQIVLYDPALRPSASTPGLRYRLEIEERHGFTPHVEGDWKFETGVPELSFGAVAEVLGELVDGHTVMQEACGLIPLGWNHVAGTGRFVVIAEDESGFHRLVDETMARLEVAYGDGVKQVS